MGKKGNANLSSTALVCRGLAQMCLVSSAIGSDVSAEEVAYKC